MKPIFLHLKACKLSDRQLKKLADAGYVTLAVDSFDTVRIAEPLLIGCDPIAKAAFQSIGELTSDFTPAQFGRRVAKSLVATSVQKGGQL